MMNEAVSRPIALQDEEAEQEKKTNKQTTQPVIIGATRMRLLTYVILTYCVELVQSPLLKINSLATL